ncbi:hypothetical protein CLHOM_12130 [Clostridium homopropionicum DSM 5847]|uniref:DUF421 domain-containing protein n=1 Tax=Clostridium homopropionicum DSM 5847 TaxID=1121318 RepID=A0A0L6ZBN0_9CLOT|nr:DUF421 domain-containing protein [Clostridium homopropionicum]KOA20394.1 hypothetical protein CLHOM_12130 [Clostridium homopropionicum DSM 5847]SFG75044.1 Uncharacterized membrane protein YcaP, DUF421 family [Clostridium homopropionicum]
MSGYFNIFLRSTISFIVLLFITRLMGRKHRSELTFFDHVVSITIGSIIASVAVDRSIKTIDSIIATTVWGVLPILVGYISMKNLFFRKIVDSEPLIIIQNGTINDKNMAKSRYHIGDLLMQLRQKNVFDITEVEFAILEPNGDLSVLKKPQYNTVTTKDLNIPTNYKGLMTELIINGQIMRYHLKMINVDIEWLLNQLKMRNITNVNDVIFAALQTDGQLYIALKNKIT